MLCKTYITDSPTRHCKDCDWYCLVNEYGSLYHHASLCKAHINEHDIPRSRGDFVEPIGGHCIDYTPKREK